MNLIRDLEYVFAQLKLLNAKQNDGASVRLTWAEKRWIKRQLHRDLKARLGEGKSITVWQPPDNK